MMTEEHKEIDKKKKEDKEKIKKMEDLLKRTRQQIHTLVKLRNFILKQVGNIRILVNLICFQFLLFTVVNSVVLASKQVKTEMYPIISQ